MKTVEAASLEGLALPLGFEPAHARVRVGPEGPEVVLWEAWKLEWGRLGGVGAYWAEVHLRAEDGAAALVLVERRHNWESKELVLAGPREDPRYALRVPTGRGRKFFSLLPALETALTSLLPAFRGRRVLPAALKAQDALRKLAPLVKGRAPFARRGGFSLVRGGEGAVLWNAEAAPPWLRPLLDLLPEGGPALLPLPGAEGAALEVSVRPDPEDPGRAEVFLEGLRLEPRAVWDEVAPILFPEDEPASPLEERAFVLLLERWLEAVYRESPRASRPRLFRQDFHPRQDGHLLAYALLTPRGGHVAVLAWKQTAPLPESWRHAEPPPEEVFALFPEGESLLEGLSPEEVEDLYFESLWGRKPAR